MNNFLNNFKKTKKIGKWGFEKTKKIGKDIDKFANYKLNQPKKWQEGKLHSPEENFLGENLFDDTLFDDRLGDDNYNPYVENVQPAQKPASFHHFILENQYKDLEKSIRGYKDVYNKDKREWEIKRKAEHCFIDEESEEILRTTQVALATDIKLTFYDKTTFGIRFLAFYDKLEFLFKRIMEYRFGRFRGEKKQGQMKEQALKIFVEIITRVEANFLRALQGSENKLTHQSVQSQESLQGGVDSFKLDNQLR